MQKIDLFVPRQQMERHSFEIFRYRNSYINEIELHNHEFYEIYLFLNGKVTYSIESRNYALQSGDILLISPMELHRPIISQARSPYERIVLWVRPQFIEQYSSCLTNLAQCFNHREPYHTNLLRPSEEHRRDICTLMDLLISESASTAYGADLSCLSHLLNILVCINRLAAFVEKPALPANKTESTINNVTKYISEHYAENLSLDDLAAQFFISKYHLSHQFNKLVGTSVYRYILQKRLIMARQLLSDGIVPTVACTQCGFSDYANFYRAFKAKHGISPKAYLQENK